MEGKEMKVKFVGFGGYMEVPCYEDEEGKLYFDENNGHNGLNLYTGAYRDGCNEILGEPNIRVEAEIKCDDPFVRSSREHDYAMLDRLLIDCRYYIKCVGKCRTSSLWSDINTIIGEMTKILESFSDDEKPEWLTDLDFEELKNKIKEI